MQEACKQVLYLSNTWHISWVPEDWTYNNCDFLRAAGLSSGDESLHSDSQLSDKVMRKWDEEQERIMQLDNEIIDLWDQEFQRLYSRDDTDAMLLLKLSVIN